MNKDRPAGFARHPGGKVEEGVGRLTGDIKEQVQGKLDQAAGTAYGRPWTWRGTLPSSLKNTAEQH